MSNILNNPVWIGEVYVECMAAAGSYGLNVASDVLFNFPGDAVGQGLPVCLSRLPGRQGHDRRVTWGRPAPYLWRECEWGLVSGHLSR